MFVLIFLYVYILLRKLIQKDNSLLTQSDFSKFKNLNISINNILVFAAVMNTGGIVSASYYMNCSPSAVSLSLKKFCTCFPEKLFSREGRCLIPTEEAQLLYNDISPAIRNLLYAMTSSTDISSTAVEQIS
ncbi:LysR family transcriptional regulator [Citrobacter sp. TBCS-14]|uniref:LysR family transcriptional regulator n=1 Tax=Citrobacter sp. TBCS-14 TaxID=2576409 RepID=UPI0035194085